MANELMENIGENTVDGGAVATAEKREYKEITLKFGKGCVGEAFEGKDGKSYKQIMIPNKDPEDRSPWATFVVRANSVHDDQFGKGMWIKLPSEGSTTIRKSKAVGIDENGKRIFETEKNKVSNTELKGMVEFYKERPRENTAESDRLEDKPKASLKDKVEKNKETVANKSAKAKTKEMVPKSKGAEL